MNLSVPAANPFIFMLRVSSYCILLILSNAVNFRHQNSEIDGSSYRTHTIIIMILLVIIISLCANFDDFKWSHICDILRFSVMLWLHVKYSYFKSISVFVDVLLK